MPLVNSFLQFRFSRMRMEPSSRRNSTGLPESGRWSKKSKLGSASSSGIHSRLACHGGTMGMNAASIFSAYWQENGTEYWHDPVTRLYFVDTPEAETAYRDRIAEQAAYFGITKEQAIELAREASAFTEKHLAAPFTVWTRWRSALGRSALGRNYVIIITADGRDLNELLVENGLARIYGTKTALYDGRDSKKYVARLAELEAKAKAEKRGGWRFTEGQ